MYKGARREKASMSGPTGLSTKACFRIAAFTATEFTIQPRVKRPMKVNLWKTNSKAREN